MGGGPVKIGEYINSRIYSKEVALMPRSFISRIPNITAPFFNIAVIFLSLKLIFLQKYTFVTALYPLIYSYNAY